MEKAIEFSSFFRLLNSAKEGDSASQQKLCATLEQYKLKESSQSPLHQLGETFIAIGIKELYKYSGSDDLLFIGTIEISGWDELKVENDNQELHNYLANAMISFARKESLSKEISEKWKVSKREIDKNIKLMARYITEGIIDSIE